MCEATSDEDASDVTSPQNDRTIVNKNEPPPQLTTQSVMRTCVVAQTTDLLPNPLHEALSGCSHSAIRALDAFFLLEFGAVAFQQVTSSTRQSPPH